MGLKITFHEAQNSPCGRDTANSGSGQWHAPPAPPVSRSWTCPCPSILTQHPSNFPLVRRLHAVTMCDASGGDGAFFQPSETWKQGKLAICPHGERVYAIITTVGRCRKAVDNQTSAGRRGRNPVELRGGFSRFIRNTANVSKYQNGTG